MHVACHECDLLIKLTNLPEGRKALCPRCGYTLTANHNNAQDRVIVFSITALILLALSNFFPFLTFSAQGQDRTVTLMQSITAMITEGFTSLAVLMFLSVILIPSFYLLSTIYIHISLKLSQRLIGTRLLLKLTDNLHHWNMAEIFLVGILVSFIKIVSLAEVSLGFSFWAYVLFILSMTTAILHNDKRQAWQLLKKKENLPAPRIPKDGKYKSCHVCTDIAEMSKNICDTCGSNLHARIINSVQNTWALLITSIVLYVPANILPIMRTNFLGEETTNTIMSGVIVLWEHGSYPIAAIIFIASILVPTGKIIALGWLCYSVQTRSKKSCQQKTQLYRATELVGRWSMVDVFVVAVLVALIQQGNIMRISPDWGAVAFACMVIVTVLAALSFDPRLIWDPVNKEKDYE